MTPTLFMETTRIAESRTVSEIEGILAENKADSILKEYEAGAIKAVSFKIPVNGQLIPFHLPCRWKELETLFRKSGKRPKSDDTFETWSRRVAWRQILRWVEAQFALVQTGMVKTEEVFLPYMQYKTGETVYERLADSKFRLENKS